MERTNSTVLKVRAGATALVLMALLAIEPGMSQLARSDDDSTANSWQPRQVVGGLRVAIDAETGGKIPAPPLRLETLSPELQAALRRSADGLVVVRRPDGSKYVNLEGRFMSGIAVRVGPGAVRSDCTSPPHPSQTPQPQASPSMRPEVR